MPEIVSYSFPGPQHRSNFFGNHRLHTWQWSKRKQPRILKGTCWLRQGCQVQENLIAKLLNKTSQKVVEKSSQK